ncbi:protein of unknown function [Bacillus velezensis UCMB5033]|nr:protein of unknown function [Bacillus velezensis UCMB5033]
MLLFTAEVLFALEVVEAPAAA